MNRRIVSVMLVAIASLSAFPSNAAQATPVVSLETAVAKVIGTGGSLSVTPQSLYPGDAVKFSGWLARGQANQKAVLQIRSNGVWRKLDYDYTNRRGEFIFKGYIDREPGRYVYRVLGKPSRAYGLPEVITRTRTVTVKARPGSEALPWRPGQWVETGNWRLTLGNTVLDAWPVLVTQQGADADPPPPGWSYVAVPLTFQRTGTSSGDAYWDIGMEFVGSDGVVYDSSLDANGIYYSCALNDDWSDAPELYPGASASATECRPVRTAAISGGKWRISDAETYEDPDQFVTLN